MNFESFIQSGLLEAYVLGQCTAEERALVERMLDEHPEARAELAVVEKALEGYASANAVPPPAWMKGRILERIENEAVPPASPTAPAKFSLRIFQLLALAFALLAGLFFFQKTNLNTEKTTLENRVAQLQKQIDACAEQEKLREKLEVVNNLLRNPGTRAVPLPDGTDAASTGYAYLDTASCRVALDLNSLPAPDSGKFFQLWSIVDGQTVSMGMVDLEATGGWQVVACRQNAVMLAISEENNPDGNPAPTQVRMIGSIPAG